MSAAVKRQPATPLPHKAELIQPNADGEGGGLFVLSEKRDTIAEFFAVHDTAKPFAEQNAAYYAHAANAYPRLVAALKPLIEDLTYGTTGKYKGDGGEYLRALLRDMGEA